MGFFQGIIINDTETKRLKEICAKIAEEYKDLLSWKIDERFNAVLAEFEGEAVAKVKSILDKYFPDVWTSSSIFHAPKPIQKLSSCFGGLLPGQEFYTTSPDENPIICVAWWPWGNGVTISIRISSTFEDLSDDEARALYGKLRKWFRIP